MLLILLTILNEEFDFEIDEHNKKKLVKRLIEEEERQQEILIEYIEDLLRDLNGHHFER